MPPPPLRCAALTHTAAAEDRFDPWASESDFSDDGESEEDSDKEDNGQHRGFHRNDRGKKVRARLCSCPPCVFILAVLFFHLSKTAEVPLTADQVQPGMMLAVVPKKKEEAVPLDPCVQIHFLLVPGAFSDLRSLLACLSGGAIRCRSRRRRARRRTSRV